MSDVKPPRASTGSGRREMYAAQTRAAVLAAARSLFVEQGFERTSVEDIARGATASKGAVYHHFRDKQEIFTEVFRASTADVLAEVGAALSTPEDSWTRLENTTRTFLRSYVADHDARTLLRQSLSVLGWDRVRAIDEDMSLPLVRAVLAQFVSDGVVRDVPLDVTAELLLGLYVDAVLLMSTRPTDEMDTVAADVERVVLSLLSGLRADPQ